MSIRPRSYQDRVVWITGASSGIGAALAKAFAHRDAILVLSARREDRLDAVRRRCVHGERHRVVPLDLTDSAAIPVAVEAVLARLGRVDVLVNNGGLTQRSAAKDMRAETVKNTALVLRRVSLWTSLPESQCPTFNAQLPPRSRPGDRAADGGFPVIGNRSDGVSPDGFVRAH